MLKSYVWIYEKSNRRKNNYGRVLYYEIWYKKKTTLSDDKLMEALDIYWDEYKVFDKLK